jgi:hypothetical protein
MAQILADDVERILADIDTDHGDCAVEFLGHGVLLCLRCPLASLARWQGGARPDHPILGHWRTTANSIQNDSGLPQGPAGAAAAG